MANMTRNLGYEGSDMLIRDPDGIKNIKHMDIFPVYQLYSYPTEVIFSGRAIRKMESERWDDYNNTTIDVFANFASGEKVHLFSINTNFFDRVKSDRDTPKDTRKYYQVPPFKFDETDKSLCAGMYSERSFPDRWEVVEKNDILKSFSAKYQLEYVAASETYDFSQQFFNSTAEKLQLELDVNEKDHWVLDMRQPHIV
jgi:hypothetical protein